MRRTKKQTPFSLRGKKRRLRRNRFRKTLFNTLTSNWMASRGHFDFGVICPDNTRCPAESRVTDFPSNTESGNLSLDRFLGILSRNREEEECPLKWDDDVTGEGSSCRMEIRGPAVNHLLLPPTPFVGFPLWCQLFFFFFFMDQPVGPRWSMCDN